MYDHNDEAHLKRKKSRVYLTILFFVPLLLLLGIISIFVMAGFGSFGEMPSLRILEDPKTNFATEIISSDGVTLGKIYLNENRTPLDYKDISPNLVKALVATEDERFYEHSGIDFIGTLRAVVFLGSKGGGSTITQQLAKQLFVGRRSNDFLDAITQKIKEWVIALQLERNYTKNEILAMYFNIYDFNNHADGIRSASRIYFGKEPLELNLEESAILVGMFKNSSLYNPLRNQEGVKNRRNVVLTQIYKSGYITKRVMDSLIRTPLKVSFHPESHNEGTATYFREHIRGRLAKWIKNNPKPDGTMYNLYLDGLKVYTTIDSRMQTYAEEAVVEHMKNLQDAFFSQTRKLRSPSAPFTDITPEERLAIINRSMMSSERWRHMKYDLKKDDKEIRKSFLKKTPMTVFSWGGEIDTVMRPLDSMLYYKHFLRTGVASVEPQTGHVKVWVGGIDYKHFKYDQVIQGSRQAGSTFKPFVYGAAVDQMHYSPCDSLPDVLHCIEANKYGNPEVWCPKNSENNFSGKMTTLKSALANSMNSITATLMDKVGPYQVKNIATKLGITTDIPAVPSIALGTVDVKLLEMVGAYGTFANKGVYVEPIIITRIEDKNGASLYTYKPKVRDVVSENVAYTLVSLLKGVTEYGSGVRLRGNYNEEDPFYKQMITGYPYNFQNPIAGKTGTTQNQSDAWFIGMVPNLVCGVWVGGEDRSIHFSSITYGQGASMALPIWGLFIKKCYADQSLNVSKDDFVKPKNFNLNLDCKTTGKQTETEEVYEPFEF